MGPSLKKWVPRPAAECHVQCRINLLQGLSKRRDSGQRKRAGAKREQMSVKKGAIRSTPLTPLFDP